MRIIPKIGINSKHMQLSGNFIGDQGVGNHKVCVNAMAYLQNNLGVLCDSDFMQTTTTGTKATRKRNGAFLTKL